MKSEFLGNNDLRGIIVGGPGHTKNEFVDGNYITDQTKTKSSCVKRFILYWRIWFTRVT